MTKVSFEWGNSETVGDWWIKNYEKWKSILNSGLTSDAFFIRNNKSGLEVAVTNNGISFSVFFYSEIDEWLKFTKETMGVRFLSASGNHCNFWLGELWKLHRKYQSHIRNWHNVGTCLLRGTIAFEKIRLHINLFLMIINTILGCFLRGLN